MKAAYLTGIEEVQIREAPEPRLEKPDEVKLQVEAVGVCGSDMHYYRTGRIGDQVVKFPFPVGHEFSAKVMEVGEAVANVAPGDRVAIDPLIACGRCDQCQAGREHTCRNQAFMGCPGQADGALVEYVVLPGRCCQQSASLYSTPAPTPEENSSDHSEDEIPPSVPQVRQNS